MPQQQILPTWLAINNANFLTASGIQDLRTGQDFPAGGLGLGDYFDTTEQEANSASTLSVGLLHHGRYRLVNVDSGATVANVKTGTIGFLRSGAFVQGAVATTPGTGGTAGTYSVPVPINSGNGNGAVLSITIAPSPGGIAAISVAQGGAGYTATPAITNAQIAAVITGLTGAVVALELNSTPNRVTSSDQATASKTAVCPVVFLNSITPGNYGFVQELGLATILGSAAGTANNFVNVVPASGLGVDSATYGPLTIGQSIDAPIAGLFKAYLDGPMKQD
jgi:hypothetical protein